MSAFKARELDPENSSRKIVVIGSTGRTGRLVLDEGLRRGHSMTAFTRRPERLEGVSRLKSVVQGDGRNVDDVRRAVAGQDAVISIVSSEGRGPTTVMSDVTRAELDAMREAGVRRLVSVSVSAIEGRRPWILINMVRWILRKPYADFARMERLITSSSVDWTIVRPRISRTDPRRAGFELKPAGRTSPTVRITSRAPTSPRPSSTWRRTRGMSGKCSWLANRERGRTN